MKLGNKASAIKQTLHYKKKKNSICLKTLVWPPFTISQKCQDDATEWVWVSISYNALFSRNQFLWEF